MTLCYLATGDSQHSLRFMFKLGRSTVNGTMNEVCEKLWNALSDYVKPPTSADDWKNFFTDFNELWNMPHCLGASDGKHVGIQKPASSGSLWYNYKGFFSKVLLGISDARYCFSYADVGKYGTNSNSGVLKNSRMGRKFGANKMNIPSPAEIPKSDDLELPYFLPGDKIFPLSNWLMRPYFGKVLTSETQKIFNYQLSHAHQVFENTFSILVT